MLINKLDFSLGESFNEGGAGTIYRATLMNQQAIQSMASTSCVIKVMKPIENASEDDAIALFNNEISIMWLLKDSPNIIRLVGFCP